MKIKNDDYRLMREEAINFVKNNRNLFGFFELNELIDVLKSSDCPRLFILEVVREVLDELGYLPDDYNIYQEFANLIDDIHGVDKKNITEIGGGRFPRLAKRINRKQLRGKVTVYDPKLSTESSTDNLVLKKQRASYNTDIGDCDLIIGLMPCKGAEVLLELALKNKIDFVLWLCEGGPHGDEFDFYQDDQEWRNAMICRAEQGVEKNNMGKLRIKTIDRFSNNFPIIYNER